MMTNYDYSRHGTFAAPIRMRAIQMTSIMIMIIIIVRTRSVVCDRFASHCRSGVSCWAWSLTFINSSILMPNMSSRGFAMITRFTLLQQRMRYSHISRKAQVTSCQMHICHELYVYVWFCVLCMIDTCFMMPLFVSVASYTSWCKLCRKRMSLNRCDKAEKYSLLANANSKFTICRIATENNMNANLQITTNSALHWLDCIWNSWKPGYLQFATHLKNNIWQATAMAKLHLFKYLHSTGRLKAIGRMSNSPKMVCLVSSGLLGLGSVI